MLTKIFDFFDEICAALSPGTLFLCAAAGLGLVSIAVFIWTVFSKKTAFALKLKGLLKLLHADSFDSYCYREFAAKLSALPRAVQEQWDRFLQSGHELPSKFLLSAKPFEGGHSLTARFAAAAERLVLGASVLAGVALFETGNTHGAQLRHFVLLLGILCVLTAALRLCRAGLGALLSRRLKKNYRNFCIFADSVLSRSCIDEYASGPPAQSADIWEPDTPEPPPELSHADRVIEKIRALLPDDFTLEQLQRVCLLLEREKAQPENNSPQCQRKLNDELTRLLKLM